jgi:hypothetical protein
MPIWPMAMGNPRRRTSSLNRTVERRARRNGMVIFQSVAARMHRCFTRDCYRTTGREAGHTSPDTRRRRARHGYGPAHGSGPTYSSDPSPTAAVLPRDAAQHGSGPARRPNTRRRPAAWWRPAAHGCARGESEAPLAGRARGGPLGPGGPGWAAIAPPPTTRGAWWPRARSPATNKSAIRIGTRSTGEMSRHAQRATCRGGVHMMVGVGGRAPDPSSLATCSGGYTLPEGEGTRGSEASMCSPLTGLWRRVQGRASCGESEHGGGGPVPEAHAPTG